VSYSTDKLEYNAEKDIYYCSVGKPMKNIGNKTSITKGGYPQIHTLYKSRKCAHAVSLSVHKTGSGIVLPGGTKKSAASMYLLRRIKCFGDY